MDAMKAGVREPTHEEIKANARIGDGFAAWYPQMGGYASKCVVVPNDDDSCFDVWVWHDGSFPFSSEDVGWDGQRRSPAHLHHCNARQFVQFGELVERLAQR